MKISEITEDDIAAYLRLDKGTDTDILENIRVSVIEYMKSYTGMNDRELDEHEEFYAAFMVLAQDMYDNRSYVQSEKAGVNKVVDSILGLHRKNLL